MGKQEEENEAHIKRVRKQLEKSMQGTKWRFLKVTLPKTDEKEEPKEEQESMWIDALLVTAIGLALGAGITIKFLIR